MTTTVLLWILPAVAALLVAALAVFHFRQRSQGERERRYVQRLEETHGYLQEHITRLDNLVLMLGRLFRMGMGGSTAAGRKLVCDTIVENACRLLQARAASLLILDADGQTLSVCSSAGLPPEAAAAKVRLGEGIIGRVAETGKPIYVEDLRADKRFLRSPASAFETQPMASAALHLKDRVIGVLTVNGDAPRAFEEREARLLGILADQAAVVLENLDLYESLRRTNADLMQTLLQALSAKEAAPQAALTRAPHYARGVAHEMNLPEQLVQFVEYAAMMRSIGKIGIGDEILRKPGKLTREEYDVMKRHPKIGSQILSPLSFLAPAAPMVLYHQEWYNGQGYPEGLAGEEIPLGARIVAVVSAWEAMTSDRPYRKALALDAARAELRRGAGTQFDPKVVEAFLKFFERDRAAA